MERKEEKEREKAKTEKGKREKAKEAKEKKRELAILAKKLDTLLQTVGRLVYQGDNLKLKGKAKVKTEANPGDPKIDKEHPCGKGTQVDSQQWENRHLDSLTGLNANLPNQAHAQTPNVLTGTLESAMHGKLDLALWGTSANSCM